MDVEKLGEIPYKSNSNLKRNNKTKNTSKIKLPTGYFAALKL